jgi:toxin CcdB
MAQYDIYEIRGQAGYWLDCQSELLEGIDTRFVVPLILRETAPRLIPHLNPIFEIGDQHFVMLTEQAGPIPAAELRHSVGSLAGFHYDIIRALDMLISGV